MKIFNILCFSVFCLSTLGQTTYLPDKFDLFIFHNDKDSIHEIFIKDKGVSIAIIECTYNVEKYDELYRYNIEYLTYKGYTKVGFNNNRYVLSTIDLSNISNHINGTITVVDSLQLFSYGKKQAVRSYKSTDRIIGTWVFKFEGFNYKYLIERKTHRYILKEYMNNEHVDTYTIQIENNSKFILVDHHWKEWFSLCPDEKNCATLHDNNGFIAKMRKLE